jgi:nitrite transporter NirC
MNTNDISNIAQSAQNKSNTLKKQAVKYFIQAMMAGVFVTIGVIFSNVSAAYFIDTPAVGRMISGIVFAIGILLVIFVGGELFTGNVFVMFISGFTKKVSIKGIIAVLVISLLGNIVGSIIFGSLFVASGASGTILTEYLSKIYMNKLDMPLLQMFLRAILCNFMVCLCIVFSFRLKSENAKIIMCIFAIGMFVVIGLEHCVANAGLFTIFFLTQDAPMGLMLKSMVVVTLGNIVGGGLLLGIPAYLMRAEAK